MNEQDHQHQIFHQDKFGYVAFCSCCESFQISFGNIFVVQRKRDLIAFAALVDRYYNQYKNESGRYDRDIHMNTPYGSISFLFSTAELEKLNTMLQKTLLILEATKAIRLQ